MSRNVKEVLKNILDCFESGDIPQAVAYSIFPVPDLPSSKWSLFNRITVFLSGTADARGSRQWKEANRYIKKGAKAVYILVPRMIKRKNREEEDGDDEEQEILAGFMARPVFKVEDTDGKPLDYQQIELPELPLIERAKEWGISVRAIPGNYCYYGYFSQDKMEIALATKEESVFFHELAHAAHQRIIGKLKGKQSWKEEIVAELSAAVLCRVVGKTSKYLGNNFKYIKHYAEEANLKPARACLKVIGDVEKVLELILEGHKKDRRIFKGQ